jgi:hypothetical protein
MPHPGEVVRIRVNPRDMMSVVDVVETLGFNYTGMSFSAACAITLSSVLELLRSTGNIPNRDGFEFEDRLKPFELKSRTKRKLQITNTINLSGDEFRVPAIQLKPATTRAQRVAKMRYDEMCLKRDAQEPFTAEDEAEWTRVLAIIAGETTE